MAPFLKPIKLVVLVDDVPSKALDILKAWGNEVGMEVWTFKDCWYFCQMF